MGAEIDLSDFSMGSQLRTTAHDTGMSTWARLSPDLGTRKATDAAYAVGHALSDALDVLKAAAPLLVAAELERFVSTWEREVEDLEAAGDMAGAGFIAESAAILRARASELRGEGQHD